MNSFVAVTPEEIAKWSEVSDEDAKKAFEQRRSKLGTPERRQVSQIVFPNAEEAAAARARIAGGTSFEDIAKERGLTSKEVLAKLQSAGIEVKAAASSVEEEVAAEALDAIARLGRRARTDGQA